MALSTLQILPTLLLQWEEKKNQPTCMSAFASAMVLACYEALASLTNTGGIGVVLMVAMLCVYKTRNKKQQSMYAVWASYGASW